MSLSFHSTENRFIPRDIKKRKAWITNAISKEGFSFETIQFIFCSDNYLLDINKKFLSHDYYTDVITFSDSFGSILNGEIFISVERVQENARIYNNPVEQELNRVMIHGILHLMGYSDSTNSEKDLMTKKENYFLSKY